MMRYMLYDEYKWLADVVHTTPLIDIVHRIINNNDAENIYQSSILAVAMAYLDYKNETRVLSDDDHRYTRYRGGVLGMIITGNNVHSITLREYLEFRDPGFSEFTDNVY